MELGMVLQLVRNGELRKAMQRLCSAGLAQGSAEELAAALQNKFICGECPQAEARDESFRLGGARGPP
eukprot:4023152-Karenia_brevis.AAC.1